ncbi:MAG: cobyrinate a,c-diamide synthase [Pyrinomonadaceae bacterium]
MTLHKDFPESPSAMNTPALVIAGTHSGVGKTTISIALMAALRRRGMRVQPFKVGPDFIDPTLHTLAAGRISRNLDGWMLSSQSNIETFAYISRDAEIAVIEGVMGLFDGRDALTEAGSTAEIAKLLGVPVVLIIDASAMARSAAAMVLGYESFDKTLDVAGVIFNRVAGASHFAYLRDAVEAGCRARVLGWLPSDERVRLPERHLGLVMGGEVLSAARLDALVNWIEAGLDIDKFLCLARTRSRTVTHTTRRASIAKPDRRTRIGVARDRAFCFYYQENLDLLENYGAEIVEFSPLADAHLPEAIDGLYFGGGYPELYAAELAANDSMRAEVALFAHSNAPVYAECGGLMYLTEAIVDTEGREHSMVGVFPTRARMQPCLAALGYVEVEGMKHTECLGVGEKARGHEFRYSTIDEMPGEIARSYCLRTKAGERTEGFTIGRVLASYIHLHFGSCPEMAARFVAACAGR